MSLCYLITDDISRIIDVDSKPVSSSLDAAFYLIAGAGVAALVAVTLSLTDVTCERHISRQSHHHSDMQLTLVNDVDDVMLSVNDELGRPPSYEEGTDHGL